MEQIFNNENIKEVDYLIGDDPYKSTWMNNRRERWGLIAYNVKTFIGFSGCILEILGRSLKFTFKKFKILFNISRI